MRIGQELTVGSVWSITGILSGYLIRGGQAKSHVVYSIPQWLSGVVAHFCLPRVLILLLYENTKKL